MSCSHVIQPANLRVCGCRRKVYDQTGSVDDAEGLKSGDFKNLYEFFKSQLEEVGPRSS